MQTTPTAVATEPDSGPTPRTFGTRTVRAAAATADDAGDMDTGDLFVELSRGIDKSLWLLEAHLQDA